MFGMVPTVPTTTVVNKQRQQRIDFAGYDTDEMSRVECLEPTSLCFS